MTQSEQQVFLNGEFLPLSKANVSVLDRGFLLGDGIYEVIPVYSGKLFRLDHHLQRLDDSLKGVQITPPYNHKEWEKILMDLVSRTEGDDQSVYLQITRGVAPKRDHEFPKNITPTVFAMSNAFSLPDPGLLEKGISVITIEDIRWRHCNIKAITLLANVLSRQQALDEGAMDAILVRDGDAIEGAASNLFIVKDNTILTPPKSEKLLPGITRDLILELAQANKLPYKEAIISEMDLENADEIWLSSSTKEILPVTLLNNKAVGNGKPGHGWHQMLSIYQEYKQSLKNS